MDVHVTKSKFIPLIECFMTILMEMSYVDTDHEIVKQ